MIRCGWLSIAYLRVLVRRMWSEQGGLKIVDDSAFLIVADISFLHWGA